MKTARHVPRSARVLLSAVAFSHLPATAGGAEPDYGQAIKPLLEKKCFSCHGGLKQKAALRVDTVALMLKGGKSGPAVVPGKSTESLLIERITQTDPDERMPQDGAALTPDQIALLRTWVDAGTPAPANEIPEPDAKQHWAFQPVQRPEVPKVPGKNPHANKLDAFEEAALVREKLTPLPEAPRAVLLRRVYLDLIGLPPTRDELHAFLDD